MRQALAALMGAGATAAACYSIGWLVLDRLEARRLLRRGEVFPLAFTLGAAILHLLVFGVLVLQIAYRPVLIALLAAPVVVWLLKHDSLPVGPQNQRLPWPMLLTIPYAAIYFVNAWAPEVSADGSGYHLGLVARYLRAHGFERITTDWYAALSGGVEMLYIPAFALGRHSAASLLHFVFAVALALAILAFGRRIGKPWIGAGGAVLTFLSPVVGMESTTAYVDVAVAAIVFSAFYWIHVWDEQKNNKLLFLAGLLGGYAYAAKYTAASILLFSVGFVWIRSRNWKSVLSLLAPAAAMTLPWILRNWFWFQNPIAPFANQWFRNSNFYVLAEQDWAAWLRHYDLPSLWQLPLEVTVRGFRTNGLIGMVFLLTPLALIATRDKIGRRLLAAAGCILLTYPGNIGTRFLIPALPFLALALAMVFESRRWILGGLMVVQAVSAWPWLIPHWADKYAWHLERFPVRQALRIASSEEYLRRWNPEYGIARLIEDRVPAGEPVLAMNGTAHAYTTRDVRVSFQAAANQALADTINMGWDAAIQPSRVRGFRFPARQLRDIRVVQTAEAEYPEQWNIHELRVLAQGHELPRREEWRLASRPNPWDIQLAFDNSPVTRWRSWEVASPGMYVSVDFGREETVDEVRMETSPDYVRVRFALEGDGHPIAAEPFEEVLPAVRNIRRWAARELRLRGVHYLLIRPGEFGAEDFRQDPEGWGLEIAGEVNGAVLYKVSSR